MVPDATPLLTLLALIDTIPLPAAEPTRRGRPPVFGERLFLKGVVVMVLKRVTTVHGLRAVLEQDTPEMRQVRRVLTAGGRFPSRRRWERRLAASATTLPADLACLGDDLVTRRDPWQARGRAVAIDRTPWRARGGVRHKKDREAGIVPHTAIDTDAHRTKSGDHGWVDGGKRPPVVTVAAVWIPLRARSTPANVADNEQALLLLKDLPAEVRFILGDTHDQDEALHTRAATEGCRLVATNRGAYPHQDDGVDVRRMLHPPTAHPRDRQRQRAVQGDLRRHHRGADARPDPDRPLDPGRHPRRPIDPAPSPSPRPRPPRRAQTFPPSRLTIYDQVSSSSLRGCL